MNKTSIATACLLLLALASCANTAHGMATDAKDTGEAMQSSTHRVLKASSN
jgi:predicted small secreted protein